jgi:hypothetical protein
MSIRGKPFTATRTYTDKRKDVNSLQTENPPLAADFTIARDEKGRIHYEMAFEKVSDGKLVIGGFDVQVYDPISHVLIRYFLNGDHNPLPQAEAEFRKLKLMSELVHPLPSVAAPKETDDEPSDPDSSVPAEPAESMPDPITSPAVVAALPPDQDFPKRSIDGVIVVGHRTVLRYGKKQELFQIQDNWFSPEYAVDMRQIVLRESVGTEAVETHDIIPGEPDPSLFEVPPGYKILLKR